MNEMRKLMEAVQEGYTVGFKELHVSDDTDDFNLSNGETVYGPLIYVYSQSGDIISHDRDFGNSLDDIGDEEYNEIAKYIIGEVDRLFAKAQQGDPHFNEPYEYIGLGFDISRPREEQLYKDVIRNTPFAHLSPVSHEKEHEFKVFKL